jgi:hypothetical protein
MSHLQITCVHAAAECFAERCVCLVDLNPALTKEDIEDWLAGYSLKPTKVVLDNEIKNAKALQPAARVSVSWIVEISDSEINFENIDYVQVEIALRLSGLPLHRAPLPVQSVGIQRV